MISEFSGLCRGPAFKGVWYHPIHISRDTADGFRSGVNVRAFPVFLQDRCVGCRATVTLGIPNDVSSEAFIAIQVRPMSGSPAGRLNTRRRLVERFQGSKSYGMPETAASVGWKVKDAIVGFHGIGRLVAQGRQRVPSYFNIQRGNSLLFMLLLTSIRTTRQ